MGVSSRTSHHFNSRKDVVAMRLRAINAIGAVFALVSGVTVLVAVTAPAIAEGCTDAPVAVDDSFALYQDSVKSYVVNSLVLPNDQGNGATPLVDQVTTPDNGNADAWIKSGSLHLKLDADSTDYSVNTTYSIKTDCGSSNFASVAVTSLAVQPLTAHRKPDRKVEFVNKNDKPEVVKMWNAWYGYQVKADKVFTVPANGHKTVRRFHYLEAWRSKMVINFPNHPTVPGNGGDLFCKGCPKQGHG